MMNLECDFKHRTQRCIKRKPGRCSHYKADNNRVRELESEVSIKSRWLEGGRHQSEPLPRSSGCINYIFLTTTVKILNTSCPIDPQRSPSAFRSASTTKRKQIFSPFY